MKTTTISCPCKGEPAKVIKVLLDHTSSELASRGIACKKVALDGASVTVLLGSTSPISKVGLTPRPSHQDILVTLWADGLLAAVVLQSASPLIKSALEAMLKKHNL